MTTEEYLLKIGCKELHNRKGPTGEYIVRPEQIEEFTKHKIEIFLFWYLQQPFEYTTITGFSEIFDNFKNTNL